VKALAPLGVLGLSFLMAFLLASVGTNRWQGTDPSGARSSTPVPTNGPLRLARLDPVRLTDQHGAPFALEDLTGQLLVMNFFFSGCARICPVQTAQLRKARESLATNADVRFLSVSITPDADTPDRLAAFAERHGIDHPLWRLASADRLGTAELMGAMGVAPAATPAVLSAVPDDPAQPGHRDTVFLFDADGLMVQQYRGDPLDVERLVREVRQLAALKA